MLPKVPRSSLCTSHATATAVKQVFNRSLAPHRNHRSKSIHRLMYMRSTCSNQHLSQVPAALANGSYHEDKRVQYDTFAFGMTAAMALVTTAIMTVSNHKSNIVETVDCEPGENNAIGTRAKNIMLHRLRSVRARDMKDKYKVVWEKVLGEGAYGSVHPAYNINTGEKFALKKISKRFTNNQNFKTETAALLRIFDNGGHPNISGLRDMYEDFNTFFLILDLVKGGEMFDHLVNYGPYSEADAARLMQEVASALAFLHGVGVVHADLKPENLLICSSKTSDGTIKIIDFGSAVVSHDNYHDDDDDDDEDEAILFGKFGRYTSAKSEKDIEMRPQKKGLTPRDGVDEGTVFSTGTTAYWSPERFRVKGAHVGGDMWSVGVILYIMLTGVHPFDLQGMSTDEEIENRIKSDPRAPIHPRITGHLSDSAIDLIKKLMEPDPTKRLSANGMLKHPWIRGDTALTTKMMDSDKKLMKFKDLRDQLEAGIFSVLISQSVDIENKAKQDNRAGVSANLIKRAFEVFDTEGKGFVTGDDLGSIIPKQLKGEASSDLDKGAWNDLVAASKDDGEEEMPDALTLSDFSNVFAGMRRRHFPKGHIVLRHGDKGDAMYFLNSGKVEVTTRTGKLVGILRAGSFFGEGSLLDPSKTRSATARCVTPVDVIEITRADFEKYMGISSQAKVSLKSASQARKLQEAKNIIRFNQNLKVKMFKKNVVVYREGDPGHSMYFIDEVDGGTFDVYHDNNNIHRYHSGDSFGESSILYDRPRSSTVVCASESCKVHEMTAANFLSLVESSPETAQFLHDMCSKRLLKKAMGIKKDYSSEDLKQIFDDADLDQSGKLHLDELRVVMKKLDKEFPEDQLQSLMKSLDLDEDGSVSFEEFKRLFTDVARNSQEA